MWCIHHYVIVLCNFVLCNLMSLYSCCTCVSVCINTPPCTLSVMKGVSDEVSQ